jgi:hypothetical protein
LIFPAAKWHISGISIFGSQLKIPARKVNEGHESVKNKKDVLKSFKAISFIFGQHGPHAQHGFLKDLVNPFMWGMLGMGA